MHETWRELEEDGETQNADGAESEPRPIAAVMRALKVLELLANSDERTVGVSELARLTGMSRSGAYRILVSLRAGGFVEYDEDRSRYALGTGALRVGSAYHRHNDLLQIAGDSLRRLALATGETSTLSVRRQWTRVCLDQVVSPHELNVTVKLGVAYPLHAGASSKAILAFLPDEEIRGYLSRGLKPLTAHTIIKKDELWAQIQEIRKLRYAMSEEERQIGAVAAAAPIFARSGAVIGSLSVTGPVSRMSRDFLGSAANLVADEARNLSLKTS